MKRLIASIILACGALCFASQKSDAYIRNRVVMLVSPLGGCPGEQVRAASGKDYILSAKHCGSLSDKKGRIMVIDEAGHELMRKIIGLDAKSDLLIMEGIPNLRGFDVGSSTKRFQKIRTFGHGRGLPTYETDGVIIGDIEIPLLPTPETAITGMIVPGCSGGPVMDSHGDLIGVMSASDGQLGFIVRLKDIQRFLKDF